MRKTLKKMKNPRSQKTHIGTLRYLDSVTAKKVQAARTARERQVAAAAAREKASLTLQLNETKNNLQQHQRELAAVNKSVTILNQYRDENQRQIDNLNAELAKLQKNLDASSAENQLFVAQITELQHLLIYNQRQILQQLAVI
jgi:chromosome segregation ATPase